MDVRNSPYDTIGIAAGFLPSGVRCSRCLIVEIRSAKPKINPTNYRRILAAVAVNIDNFSKNLPYGLL
jgi:hypothetical protein